MKIPATILRIVILLMTIGYVLIGFTGMMRPERMAEVLSLLPQAPEGIASIRAVVGAQYLAMGLVGIYAAIRIQPSWLIPLAAVEGVMVLARIISMASGELDAAGFVSTLMEFVAASLLALGATLPIRAWKTSS